MLATQFWHANQGGLAMGWYLPLLILTIFRPNLETASRFRRPARPGGGGGRDGKDRPAKQLRVKAPTR